VVCTQIVATLIAVHGPLNSMTPLGWKWALLVWGFAPAWFLIENRVKLLACRVFDPGQRALLRLGGSLLQHFQASMAQSHLSTRLV
jgi:H+-transporting ATPase